MIRYIALYVLLTSVIVALVNEYVASSDVYTGKTRKIDRNYAQLERFIARDAPFGLAIGNSYVYASFDTGDDSYAKFTVGGMPLADTVRVIEALPQDAEIDTIFVGLGYNFATPTGSDETSYKTHLTTNPVVSWWYEIPLVRGRPSLSIVLREEARYRLGMRKPKGADVLDRIMAESPPSVQLNESQMERSVVTRLREYGPFVAEIHPRLPELLHRLKKAVADRGPEVQLVTFTAPIYSELRAQLDPEVLQRFRETVAASGIEYTDLNLTFPDWDASHFQDATHTTRAAGRTLITPELLAIAQR